ncbi:MAG: rRNA maturation RNase YbeY [Deltaproteobacteria bacterium]|nr:rRNA maturation RNase YbeY [Deltaproteobacteria bacterium]
MTPDTRVVRQAGFSWQCPFSRKELAAALDAMRQPCGLDAVPLELTLTDDASISRINREFLGCRGPTNILSFPPRSGGGPAAASLVLSLDTLERECLLYGQGVAEHTVRLLAHGMAHVGGYDHGPAMELVQEAAFAAGKRAVGREAG